MYIILWTLDFRLRTSDYGLWTMTSDFGLRNLDYGLIGLRTLDYGLRTSDYGAVGTPRFVVLLEYRSGHYKYSTDHGSVIIRFSCTSFSVF